LAELRIGESCYGLSRQTSAAKVVVAVTVDYVDKTAGCTDLGLSSDA